MQLQPCKVRSNNRKKDLYSKYKENKLQAQAMVYRVVIFTIHE